MSIQELPDGLPETAEGKRLTAIALRQRATGLDQQARALDELAEKQYREEQAAKDGVYWVETYCGDEQHDVYRVKADNADQAVAIATEYVRDLVGAEASPEYAPLEDEYVETLSIDDLGSTGREQLEAYFAGLRGEHNKEEQA